MLSLPIPFCSLSVSLVCFQDGQGCFLVHAHCLIYTPGAPLQLIIYPLPAASIFANLLLNSLCLLIEMSVCAAQSAPTESFSTLVLCGIPLPSCSKVWSGQIYSVLFVSAAPNTSPVKRRRAAVNVSVHLCEEWCNGAIVQPFFWCF